MIGDEPKAGASVWHVLTLALPADTTEAEPVAEWIRDHLGREPVQLDRPHAAHTWLEIYFDEWSVAEAAAVECCAAWPAICATQIRRCDSRDWETFWRLHFKPQPIGRRLFITPAWESAVCADPQRVVLRIVPGLSFGTGTHFTTRFCLETIDAKAAECRTLWDVGCGSGILGVAGALLGIADVLGTDNDAICLAQAADNAQLNGVSARTCWRLADVIDVDAEQRFARRYDLVCANIFAALLMQSAPTLWAATGRYLALSGIREFEVDAVAETFRQLGAAEIIRDGDGDWAGLLLERR